MCIINKYNNVDRIDAYIGSKLKLRRTILGMSQEIVGLDLKVTTQQIQKYEKGVNRISGANLYRLTKTLKVSLTYFFDGIEDNKDSLNQEKMYNVLDNEKELFSFIASYNRIAIPQVRKKIADLVTALSNQYLPYSD